MHLPKHVVRATLRLFGYRLSRCAPPIHWVNPVGRICKLDQSFEFVLAHYLQAHPKPFFIQVGANDGKNHDPLHRFIMRNHLRGVLIEPQPEVFSKLVENYRSASGLVFKNVAIAERSGRATLYKPGHIDPVRASRVASLDRDKILKEFPGAAVVSESVQCTTVEELYDELMIDYADILVIDAEGHDHKILDQFDVETRKPAIIHFEHFHLAPQDWHDTLQQLSSLGYRLCLGPLDTTAYLYKSLAGC